MQKEKEGLEQLFSFLASHRNAGVEKLFVTWKALNFRKRHELIFREGTYRQLQVIGTDTFAVSYARQLKDQWVLVVLPLALDHPKEANVSSKEKWKGSYIELPDYAPTQWKNIFSGKIIQQGGGLLLDQVFLEFPVALLLSAKVGES
jgi:(1->4)-alpha-D-glucan 1-alpha-D-glucosylmutase